MNILLENPSKMILQDGNQFTFFGNILFLAGGIAIFIIFAFMGSYSLGIVFGAILCIIGLYSLLSTKTTRVVLDKANNSGSFSLKSFLKDDKNEMIIKDIKKLELTRERRDSYKNARYVWSLKFILKNGEEQIIEFGSVTVGALEILTIPDQRFKDDAAKVSNFLGVPLTD